MSQLEKQMQFDRVSRELADIIQRHADSLNDLAALTAAWHDLTHVERVVFGNAHPTICDLLIRMEART